MSKKTLKQTNLHYRSKIDHVRSDGNTELRSQFKAILQRVCGPATWQNYAVLKETLKHHLAPKMALRQSALYVIAYMISSTGIMFTNKLVLTTYNLPMFSALRRVSNLLILIGEHIFLGNDLAFNLIAYTYVGINNLSTAGKALLTKAHLGNEGFSSIDLLYYNSLFMTPFMALLALLLTDFNEVINFKEWFNPAFILCFLFSCCSAVLLNYSLFQCTQMTSALTTSIIGVIKNIIVTYAGMFVGGDYIFSPLNFLGVSVSAFGAILYTVVAYRASTKTTSKCDTTKSIEVKQDKLSEIESGKSP